MGALFFQMASKLLGLRKFFQHTHLMTVCCAPGKKIDFGSIDAKDSVICLISKAGNTISSGVLVRQRLS